MHAAEKRFDSDALRASLKAITLYMRLFDQLHNDYRVFWQT